MKKYRLFIDGTAYVLVDEYDSIYNVEELKNTLRLAGKIFNFLRHFIQDNEKLKFNCIEYILKEEFFDDRLMLFPVVREQIIDCNIDV